MNAPLTTRNEPIPGYRLLDRLGRGGFGEVWKCEAPGGIHKAIKFVYGDLEGAAEDGKPAEQEFKALKRVKEVRHPFILNIERYEVVEGQLMIVMELADRNLWDRYRECKTQNLPGIPREEMLRYMEEAAEALDLMNLDHNLQHLDIKPQNLFLVHKHIKVADFGLVKDFEGLSASVTGGVTPVYAAPETFEGRVTRFCDQYSLAIVYQELLTGQRPFNGTTTRQLLLQHIQAPPDLMPLPASDRAAVGRALSKKPDQRFPSCLAFMQALRLSEAHELQARGPEPVARVPEPALPPLTPRPGALPPRPPSLAPQYVPKASELISRRDPSMTQRAGAAPATMQRPDLNPSVLFDRIPTAPPELTGDGCLRPGFILGVGHMGGLVVRQLRQAILDQCGSAAATPHLRLLAVDTDSAAIRNLLARGVGALEPQDVYTARLNRPSHYLNKGRDTGAPVESWMPPHLLYRLPRQPVTTGLRGLGRLALWDHFYALEKRVRAALEAVLDPAALNDADRQTQLGLRSNRPVIYVVANPAGGTGGGMVVDLAYLVRHVLRQLGHFQPEVVGVLLLPPTERAGQQSLALANTYATLAEVYHYSRHDTRYELKVNSRQAPVLDGAAPFTRCLCLPLAQTVDAATQKTAAGLAAVLVARELLTPLGRMADALREEARSSKSGSRDSKSDAPIGVASKAAPRPADFGFCHTASSYHLTWPRPQLARRAGLLLAGHLIRSWTAKETEPHRTPVQTWLDEQWEHRQLRPEQVIERVQEACQAVLTVTPDAKFDAVVAPLAERIVLGSQPDALSVCKALDEVLGLVGKPPIVEKDLVAPTALQGVLADTGRSLTNEYEQKLAELAVHFIERPQYRLAAAEEAIRQLIARLRNVFETYEALHQSLQRESGDCYTRLMQLIGTLDTLPAGSRRSAAINEILETLRTYPKRRYQEMVIELVQSLYRSMMNTAPEYLREVNFCRARLGEVLAEAETGLSGAGPVGAVGPGKELFAGGGATLDEAATRLVQSLTPDDLEDLDHRVQQQVRRQFQALVSYCLQAQGQAGPLLELIGQQSEEYLATRLGHATAAEVFFQHFADDPQAAARTLAQAYDEAVPELTVPPTAPMIDVLAVPTGLAGERVRTAAHEAVPRVDLQPADSRDEIVFYREVCDLNLTDLPQLGPAAREAYQQLLDGDQPPHARSDVKWRLPATRSSKGR